MKKTWVAHVLLSCKSSSRRATLCLDFWLLFNTGFHYLWEIASGYNNLILIFIATLRISKNKLKLRGYLAGSVNTARDS